MAKLDVSKFTALARKRLQKLRLKHPLCCFPKDRLLWKCRTEQQQKNPLTFHRRIWPQTFLELFTISKAAYHMSACTDLRRLLSFVYDMDMFSAGQMPCVQYERTQFSCFITDPLFFYILILRIVKPKILWLSIGE